MDENEIDIRAIIGLFRRRIKLIASSFILIVGIVSISLFFLTPIYTSSALIFVDTNARDILAASPQVSSTPSVNARIDSEVEILKSDNILLGVIKKENLIADAEFGIKLGWVDNLKSFFRLGDAKLPTGLSAEQSVLDNLRNAVFVKRKGLTYLITVSASSASPKKAAKIANAISSTYIEIQVHSKIKSINTAHNILQARMRAASKSVVLAETSFDSFIFENIDTIAQETGRADIAQLHKEFKNITATQANIIASVNMISQNISLFNWAEVANLLQDENFNILIKKQNSLSSQLSKIASNSQQANDIRTELSNIDNNLLNLSNSKLSALHNIISNNHAKLLSSRQQIKSFVLNETLPADISTKIYEIQQNITIAQKQYQTLLTRVSELGVQAQTQIADSKIVSLALPPNQPSFPNKKLILLLASLSALVIGIGLAVLYENFVGGFISEQQIENVLKLPVVSIIPQTEIPKKDGEHLSSLSVAEIMHTAPLSAFSEAIRRLKASIDHSLFKNKSIIKENQLQGKVIMVSSAVPCEGKSTIALSLGRAYAHAGHRVLLIDCDLRKPNLHHFLGIDHEFGLADYLRNPNKSNILSKVIVQDSESSLTAIIGSKHSKTPTDQLSSGNALAQIIETAKNQSEYIILDSPPIIPVVDGLYLAEYADVIAMIVRFATTSQGEVKEAVSSLQRVKNLQTDILMVLNQEKKGGLGYRHKYSNYYKNKKST